MSYNKESVRFHSDGYRPGNPAVRVKADRFCSVDAICKRFNCPEHEGERLGRIAWDCQCEDFWHYWQEDFDAAEHFRRAVKIYGEGRSGGWLVVHGLKPFDTWNAVDLAKWRQFENWVLADVGYRCGEESTLELIDANDWCEISDTIPTLHAIQ